MTKQEFIERAKKLHPSYVSSKMTAQILGGLHLVATVGPTGTGKTTIMQMSGLPFVVTDTTRSPRAGEKDGIDYNFRTDYEQLLEELDRGEFAQYIIEPTDEFYGTKTTSYPSEGVCTMAIVTAAIPEFEKLGFKKITKIFIVPPSFDEWRRRMYRHEEDIPSMDGRMVEAKRSLHDALRDESYIFLLNDYLQDSISNFMKIVELGKIQADSDAAKKVAVNLAENL